MSTAARYSLLRRPPVKTGPENEVASAQMSAVPPLSELSSGLTLPKSAVKPKRGKKFAFAMPILADALLRFCSASRISGRLSRRSEEHTSELQSLRHLVC